MHTLAWTTAVFLVIVGLVAGWIAHLIVGGSLSRSLVIGVVGAFIGPAIILAIGASVALAGLLAIGVVGALVVVLLVRLVL